jgi:flagellar motor protein MotB
MRLTSKALPSFALGGLMLVVIAGAAAQERTQASASPSSCTRENALEIIQQQIDLTRTLDDDGRRIAVLLRASDSIWPYQQEKARAAFAEAFEVARRDFKAKGDDPTQEGRSSAEGVDRRYTVISAIANRDPEWARKLSKQIREEDVQEAQAKAGKDKVRNERTAANLLNTATSLLTTDQANALGFAKSSLAYPATIRLSLFLFKLSEINKAAADQFYQEALNAYAYAPMDQLLYLSSYPFASHREVGEMPMWMYYAVPSGLAPNPTLQRLFVQTLLIRARELIQNPSPPNAETQWSDASQILMALTRLESQVATSLPDMSAALRESKGEIAGLLSPGDQQRVSETLADPPPKKSFDEQVEAADKLADPARRESGLAMAILNAAETEDLDHIKAAGDKIDDLDLRVKLMSRVYFDRAQQALKEKRIDDARRLAAKVDELDQRAYLYSQIATESIKQRKSDTQAREMLEDVLDAVAKAPNTEIKARALLAVAYLYSTFDPNRAVAALGDAVKTINRLDSIDLSSDTVLKRIEGKAFGFYTALRSPGFNPDMAFREIGKVDFDGTLYLASNLSDKSLRAMTTLALAEQCLKSQPSGPKPKQSKPATVKP